MGQMGQKKRDSLETSSAKGSGLSHSLSHSLSHLKKEWDKIVNNQIY